MFREIILSRPPRIPLVERIGECILVTGFIKRRVLSRAAHHQENNKDRKKFFPGSLLSILQKGSSPDRADGGRSHPLHKATTLHLPRGDPQIGV